MLGAKHEQLARWLTSEFVSGAHRVCVVQGFSGVGKTEVALEVARRRPQTAIVEAPETSDPGDLILGIGQVLAEIGSTQVANAIRIGGPPADALITSLRDPILLIIDEFQRMLDDSGTVDARMQRDLLRVATTPGAGRILALTNRSIDTSQRWAERFQIKPLSGLEPADGANLLGTLLEMRGIADHIPVARRPEIAQWLGGNPRALKVLVGCLETSPLEELVGIEPEAWEARDRDISPELIARLERALLTRTIADLSDPVRAGLRRLSTYRRPVKLDALERVTPRDLSATDLRRILTERFILDHRTGWYSLNPAARDLALEQLKLDGAEAREAHRLAAGHFTRHFTSQQIVQAHQLGGAFVEARYHLVQAGDTTNLDQIARRFAAHLHTVYRGTNRPPTRADDRDEQIAVLLALLHEPGEKGLHFYLARLLTLRSLPQDRARALLHVIEACGPQAPQPTWSLRLVLEMAERGPDAMLAAARDAFRMLPARSNLFAIYQLAGELLERAGRIDDAIALLRQGIARISPEQSLFSLYQLTGQLLERAGRIDDAIALLGEGIARISPEHNLYSLYQLTGELLERTGRIDDAIALLRDGLARISPEYNLFSLYRLTSQILERAGRMDDAFALLREGMVRISPEQGLFSLYQLMAELLERAGRINDAIALLREGCARIRPEQSLVVLYQLMGEILERTGRIDDAIALLREGCARISPEHNVYMLYQLAAGILDRHAQYHTALETLNEGLTIIGRDRYGGDRLANAALHIMAACKDTALLAKELDAVRSASPKDPRAALATVIEREIAADWNGAAERAAAARTRWPRSLFLAAHEAFARLCAGDADGAKTALLSFPDLRMNAGTAATWLAAVIAVCRGNKAEAAERLSDYLGRPLATGEEPTRSRLLSMWRESIGLHATSPAFIHPNLPPAITTGPWLHRVSSSTPAPARVPDPPPTAESGHGRARRKIVAVATEWESRHGGLSTFNRSLCVALASAGHDVTCVVPFCSQAEIASAARLGVRLIMPPPTPGIDGEQRLLIARPEVVALAPDVIIGHDRKTGPYARQLTEMVPGALRVHIVHTRPEDIEWHKDVFGPDDTALRAEARRELQAQLARTASLVVGVGPDLTAAAASLVYTAVPRPPTVRLDPGLTLIERPTDLPPEMNCLLSGRAEDSRLKGLDIGAAALDRCAVEHALALRMIVRGAPPGTASQLRTSLAALAPHLRAIEIREYTSTETKLHEDMMGASLVLMPSRSEGFGLIALEAIGAGTPVLVSRRSGIASLLLEKLGEMSHPFVVETADELEPNMAPWTTKIYASLSDREAAFARARTLRERLATMLTWQAAIGVLEEAWEPLLGTPRRQSGPG